MKSTIDEIVISDSEDEVAPVASGSGSNQRSALVPTSGGAVASGSKGKGRASVGSARTVKFAVKTDDTLGLRSSSLKGSRGPLQGHSCASGTSRRVGSVVQEPGGGKGTSSTSPSRGVPVVFGKAVPSPKASSPRPLKGVGTPEVDVEMADAGDDLPSSNYSPSLLIERFLRKRRLIFSQQVKRGLASLQSRSDRAVREQFADLASAATRTERLAAYDDYLEFCRASTIPSFPITAPIIALYLHDKDVAITRVVTSLECIRLAALETWEDVQIGGHQTVADEFTTLDEDEIILAMMKENDARRWTEPEQPLDVQSERTLRSRKSFPEIGSSSSHSTSENDEDSSEDDAPAKVVLARSSSDPDVAKALLGIARRRGRTLQEQRKRGTFAKQQLSEDALDAGFEHAYSASSLSSANPVLGRYRTYCRSENIRPFPIVPAVIALYLSTTDFDTKRLGWELGFLQKAQSLTLPIWTGEEGDGLASGFLRDDPDVLAGFFVFDDPIPNMPQAGNHFPSASAFETACSNAARAFMGHSLHRYASCTDRLHTVRCNRGKNQPLGATRCQFIVRASRAWIVVADKSDWTHNHGRHEKIIADPNWRPFQRRASLVTDERGSEPVAPDFASAKRRASHASGGDDVERCRLKRGKFVKREASDGTTPPVPIPAQSSPAPLPSPAVFAYATPALSPPLPRPLPAILDSPLSPFDLTKLLVSLSPILASPTIAAAPHRIGVNSVARFTNLVFVSEDWLEEALGEREAEVPKFKRLVLLKKLGEKRKEVVGA